MTLFEPYEVTQEHRQKTRNNVLPLESNLSATHFIEDGLRSAKHKHSNMQPIDIEKEPQLEDSFLVTWRPNAPVCSSLYPVGVL